MTLTKGTQSPSFTDDIAHSRVIEEAQAAWKTWREQQARVTAEPTAPGVALFQTPNEPSHFRVIDEAQAAWKEWSGRQTRSASPPPPDTELVQLRVWIGRGADKMECQAHVEQIVCA